MCVYGGITRWVVGEREGYKYGGEVVMRTIWE